MGELLPWKGIWALISALEREGCCHHGPYPTQGLNTACIAGSGTPSTAEVYGRSSEDAKAGSLGTLVWGPW